LDTASRRPGDDFSVKYDRYSDMLYRIAVTHLGNKQDAEDVLQEAFIRLLSRAPCFDGAEHEKAWLIRTAINLCKNRLAAPWRRRRVGILDEDGAGVQPGDADLLQEVLNLPNRYKAVIHLYYYEGYTVKQIAEILRISESAVKMRLQRGRLLLKMKLEGD
jgi:RNA polymerase sigma factor (sigma-70 family)